MGVLETIEHGLRDALLMAWRSGGRWSSASRSRPSCRPGFRECRSRTSTRRLRRQARVVRDRPRRGLLVVQLRGGGDREEPLPEGRRARVSAIAFQFASTNLVVELGLVIWILMGWQFTLAEFVGGRSSSHHEQSCCAGSSRPSLEARAREHALDADSGHQHHSACGERRGVARGSGATRGRMSRTTSVTTGRCCGRRSIGFLLAGFIGQLPHELLQRSSSSRRLQLPLRLVENAVVGPLIADHDFVCSVGNIPLAAVLWSGGIGFAGVIAFIFADLLVLPIIAIYLKYYGREFPRIVALMYDDRDLRDARRPRLHGGAA